ncbi:MAG TPA: hypothetical protein VF458_08030 [Ktedonobacteraceae bacterium]
MAVQVLNTKGAAKRLGCSITWIHKLVAAGRLKAYVYNSEGFLVEHQKDQKRQGQGLYFFLEDLCAYQLGAKQQKAVLPIRIEE